MLSSKDDLWPACDAPATQWGKVSGSAAPTAAFLFRRGITSALMSRGWRLLAALSLAAAALWLVSMGLSRSVRAQLEDQAGIWYVAPHGQDENTCRSAAAPCRRIQAALDKAGDGETIYIAQGTYTESAGTVASVTKTVTLSGGWRADFSAHDPLVYPSILDGQRLGTVVEIRGSSPLKIISPTIEGLTIVNGDGTGTAGCTAPGAGGCGGGVFGLNAVPLLLDNVIRDNWGTRSGQGYGGGIYLQGTTTGAWIRGNVIANNTAAMSTTGIVTGFGGGISLYFVSATVSDNQIENNVAVGTSSGWGYGGGVYLLRSASAVHDNYITGNRANTGSRGYGGGLSTFQCGAVYNCAGVSVSDNWFTGNVASDGGWGLGGAIQVNNATISVTGNVISGNISSWNSVEQGDGGGLFALNADLWAQGNQVLNNIATTGQRGFGGGFQLEYSQSVVESNTFAGNIASQASEPAPGIPGEQMIGYGGGINVRGCTGVCVLRRNIVRDNVASLRFSGYGGGVSLRFDPVTLDGNLIVDNRATLDSSYYSWGGGIRVDRASALTLTNNIIARNTSQSKGGGIHVWGAPDAPVQMLMVHNTLSENGAGPAGPAQVGIYLLGDVTLAMTNNIVVSHSYGLDVEAFESILPEGTASHTLFYGNASGDLPAQISSEHPIGGPPCFVEPSVDDYHVGRNSPAYQAGVPTFVAYDADGAARGNQPNLGAYEQRQIYLPLTIRNLGGPVPESRILPPALDAGMQSGPPFCGMQFVSTAEDLATVRGLGVTVVLQVFAHDADPAVWLAQLDLAQSSGLRVVGRLWPEGWEWDGETWQIDDQARLFVQTLSSHPATMAIYALHEPYWRGCDTCGLTTGQQQALYQALKSIMGQANTPLYSELTDIVFWAQQGPETTLADGVCDYCGTNYYPFFADGSYQRDEFIARLDGDLAAIDTLAPNSTLVWGMQVFAISDYAQPRRMPTAAEVADIGAIASQRPVGGIFWYVWEFGALYDDFLSNHPELFDAVAGTPLCWDERNPCYLPVVVK